MNDPSSSNNHRTDLAGSVDKLPGQRRILDIEDIDTWIHSQGYKDYTTFIRQLNDFAKGVHNRAFKSRDEVQIECLKSVVSLLDRLSTLADQVKPFDHDTEQRYFVVRISSFLFDNQIFTQIWQ